MKKKNTKKLRSTVFDDFKDEIINNIKDIKKNIPTFKEDPKKEITSFVQKTAPKKFLDSKKIILFAVMIVLAIVLIIITVTFITDINVSTILSTISKIQAHTDDIIAGWILLLIFTSFVRLIWQVESIRMRFKHFFIRVSVREWWNFGIITIFINTITIFAVGSDPYKMWWMTKRGIKLYEANAIILSSGWIIQLTQMLVSYPSLGYLIYLYFFNHTGFIHTYDTNVSMSLVCAGYCNDVLVFSALSILGFNSRLQFLIARCFNWIRKKIGLTYKSKEVLDEEFINKSKFQNAFIREIKSFEANVYIIFWTVFALLMYYFSMFFALELIKPYDSKEQVDILASEFWNTYNFANVATVANNFIPIPGGEGTLQFILISFFDSSSSKFLSENYNLSTIIKETVFLWRVFNYYLLIIFGGIYCIILGLKIYIKNKIKTKKLIRNGWFEMQNS